MMVVRDSPDQLWRLFEGEKAEIVNVEATEVKEASSIGTKRPLSPSSDVPHPKRPCRPSSDSSAACLAPPVNPTAQKIFINLLAEEPPCLGTGDLFLTEGFRERWCRCNSVSEKPEFGINFMGTIHEVYQPLE
jgi:E3 ubiquitin-protein ligase UBR7